jgi:hypothetical protein
MSIEAAGEAVRDSIGRHLHGDHGRSIAHENAQKTPTTFFVTV